MDIKDLGLKIRQFCRDLFGSRLNAHLEEELLRTRFDYETRLLERERVIADLREQVVQLSGKIDRYELIILPLTHGGMFSTKKERQTVRIETEPAQTSWEAIQADWERKQQAEIEAEKAEKK